MMRRAAALVLIAACAKRGDAHPPPRPAADVFVDPNASEQDLVNAEVPNLGWNDSADLKLDLPPGWSAHYEMKSWSVTKLGAADGQLDSAVMSIEIGSPRMPRTAAALAAQTRRYAGPDMVVKIVREEPLPEGVLVDLDVFIPGAADPKRAMTAVRRLRDRILVCELNFADDEDGRREADQICKSARR
jgi:hypothetical protein